jgi:hypothetical protein
VWIVAAAHWLAVHIHVPFVFIIRRPLLAADVGSALLLFRLSILGGAVGWQALTAPALFALNRLVLQISAAHGQCDALALLFILLAISLRQHGKNSVRWSALALGTPIALKGYPVLLLPSFIVTAPYGKRAQCALLTFAPLAVSVLVCVGLFGYSPNMLLHIAAYRSTTDLDWIYLIGPDAVVAFIQSSVAGYAAFAALYVLTQVGIIVFALFVPARACQADACAAVALVCCALHATSPTMSVQYLIWAVPFLCIVTPIGALCYSATAEVTALGFYAQYIYGAGVIPAPLLGSLLVAAASALRVPATAGLTVICGIIAVLIVAGRLPGALCASTYAPAADASA